MAWVWLTIAIFLEVAGTVCLRLSAGFERWALGLGALLLYAGSLVLLSKALHRIEAGVVTAAWSGLGILLMNLIGVSFWSEGMSGKKIGFLLLVLVGVVGLATTSSAQPSPNENVMRKHYQEMLNQLIAPAGEAPVHHIALLVRQPDRNLSFVGAAGQVQPGEALTPDHRFRIASMSKTFTATVVLQLIEEGKLALEDRVSDHLDHHSYIKFDRLLKHGYGHQITVRHLLTHQSGLSDFIFDERFAAFVADHPQVQWTPELMFEKYYAYELNDRVRFAPGEGSHYADLNYVLLALLIEHATGQSLAQNYRNRILEPLEMHETFLEFYEEAKGATPMVYPYQGELHTEAINTSFDWGGGGLVSTLEEMDTFLRALLQGELFREASTLDTMLSFRAESDNRFSLGRPMSEYGMGLRRLSTEKHNLVGHSGSWGCIMYYDTEKDLSIVATINQGSNSEALHQLFRQVMQTNTLSNSTSK